MSQKTDEAKMRMAKECQNKDWLIPFEEYLTAICTTDAVAEKILKEDKTLGKCYKLIESEAEKRLKSRTGTQCVSLTDEEGYELTRKYYEITDADMNQTSGKVIDIMDFI